MDVQPLPFEPRRFRTAAAHYRAGRPAYAPRLIRRVVELCGLAPTRRLLDLGCGPGPLAWAFAPYVGEVVGVDPEPEMLRQAAAAGTGKNVRFVEGSSYGLGPELGRFHLVTMGRSFHWMDRVDTLRRLDAMIEPGGTVVLFSDTHPEIPENAWYQGVREVVRRYSEADENRAQRRAGVWVRHEAVLLGSAFAELEQIAVIERASVTVDGLVDRALSLSSTSRAHIGDRAADLEAEIRAHMATVAPDGTVSEVVTTSALIARRPG